MELRLGMQLGEQTENKTDTLYGLHIGLLIGHQWNKFSTGMEFRYLNQMIKLNNSEAKLDRLHTFPIGFVIRNEFEKLRPEFAYYYDCAAYRDLSLIPITYGIAYGGYGSWRVGLSYLSDNAHTLGLFYEKQTYKQYKVRKPRVTTGDTIPYKVWDFWSLNVGKLF
ncbi:MAG: hypothetical protein IPM57_11040 [Oligoflexia bacterium]|nr:hypothetical protein [Oligoflexia bacterium]